MDGAFLEGARRTQFSLAGLEDPAGFVLILVGLATPIFCARQVRAIQVFVQMNAANSEAMQEAVPTDRLSPLIDRANQHFEVLGRRVPSIAVLIPSGGATLGLYAHIVHSRGIMYSWNPSDLPSKAWSESLYNNWWANWHSHKAGALFLCAVGTYLMYFLTKQLIMGLIFAQFARAAGRVGFGVTTNIRYNVDGFWGLRPLRSFMQWTYGSTLAHFAATLGVFIVWLRFQQWTVFVALTVVVLNIATVIYPTAIARATSIRGKIRYAEGLICSSSTPEKETRLQIDEIWAKTDLPFKTRSTITAITLYLIIPVLLALISSLLTN